MFNKKLYWKNRKNNKRGQGEIKYKVYKKGDESILNNKLGEHRSFNSLGQLIVQNRKEHRRRYINRTYSAKNYFTRLNQKDRNNLKINLPHKVNEHKVELTYAPSLTNNQRMKLREMGRIDKINNKKRVIAI